MNDNNEIVKVKKVKRSLEEQRAYQREYYRIKLSKDPLEKVKQKNYYKENSIKIKEYQQKRYRENPNNNSLKYYHKNVEKVLARMNEPCECECGRILQRSNLTIHRKSLVHQENLDYLDNKLNLRRDLQK